MFHEINIHGIMLTKNDWGLSAVSITHALNFVNVIHVLNHDSEDQTAAGLNILKNEFGDRLKIYTASSDIPFNQSLLSNFLISFAERDGAEWIYLLDSDEFLLIDSAGELKNILSNLEKHEIGIRYDISNFISTHNFNRQDLSCYEDLIYKAAPHIKSKPVNYLKRIFDGENTFFDFPFPSKIIFKSNLSLHIKDGAHKLSYQNISDALPHKDGIHCAHLPLISRDVLLRKSLMGKAHIEDKKHINHGWQNQLLYKLSQEGSLDNFWLNHSVREGYADSTQAPFNFTIDPILINALKQTLEKLNIIFGGYDLKKIKGKKLNV